MLVSYAKKGKQASHTFCEAFLISIQKPTRDTLENSHYLFFCVRSFCFFLCIGRDTTKSSFYPMLSLAEHTSLKSSIKGHKKKPLKKTCTYPLKVSLLGRDTTKIVSLWETMVSQRETIKGSA